MRLGVDTLLTASLRNSSPSYIAFKVKTTATERYRVRPNIGVGEPACLPPFLLNCVVSYARRQQHSEPRRWGLHLSVWLASSTVLALPYPCAAGAAWTVLVVASLSCEIGSQARDACRAVAGLHSGGCVVCPISGC